jgi:hypothetical protein
LSGGWPQFLWRVTLRIKNQAISFVIFPSKAGGEAQDESLNCGVPGESAPRQSLPVAYRNERQFGCFES